MLWQRQRTSIHRLQLWKILVASVSLESFVNDDGRHDECISLEPGSEFAGDGVAHHGACIQSSLAQANCQ